MSARLPRQLALPVPNTWGGKRRGAGRKPKGRRPLVAHDLRPYHDAVHPSHVTLRLRAGLPSVRNGRLFVAVREGIRSSQREHFRVCQFSVQSNHVHMLVEAQDRQALIRGVQGLTIRVARALNRALGRRGKVWGDRYHRRDLATPREVRNVLVYVLNNFRKHGGNGRNVDPCSSARWFDGWNEAVRSRSSIAIPVAPARTWP